MSRPMDLFRPALVAVLCLGASLARAVDEPAEDPVLEALVAQALQNNPDLLAAAEAVAAARLRPDQARALPDPMVSVLYTNDGWSPTLGSRDMTTLGLMWSQELPYPGKRGLRARSLSLEAGEAEQQLARARLGVAAALRRAYYGLVQARGLLALVGEQGEVWRQIEGVARARYAVGQGAQQDVLRTQVEVTRVGQLEAEQAAEVDIRLAELNRLLGRPPDTPQDASPALALRPFTEPAASVHERLRGLSPELKATRLGVDRMGVAVALARRDFKPDLVVQAGYMNRGRLDSMWQAGVGLSLPVARRKRQGALAEAETSRRAAERRAESVDLLLRSRTEERLAQIRAAELIAELYEKGIVPQDRMSLESAIASYQAGKVPFITVLEALGALYNDRATFIRVVTGHARARASLEEAGLEATADLPVMAGPPAAGLATGAGGGGGVASPMGGMR